MSWDQQSGETDEWYERFQLYLYMGPKRTVAAAHAFAGRLAGGAGHGHLKSWWRAAQRQQWKVRAAAFDEDLCRKALVSYASEGGWRDDERLRMVAELLYQVYGVLRHADLLTLSKEEARTLLPTLRLFFRDLLKFHQAEVVHFLASGGGSTAMSEGERNQFLSQLGGLQTLAHDLRRVNEATSEEAWRPLRDILVKLYPDEASARRIAAQAHLDSARIHFSARAVDGWHAILTEALLTGQMKRMIQVVQAEYRGNRELAEAVRHYRQVRLQEYVLMEEQEDGPAMKAQGRKGV